MSKSKTVTKKEAREALPEDKRSTFDQLCDEVIGWSNFYYGNTFVSYAILMELVKGGWSKK
jgi:hypothetical protein